MTPEEALNRIAELCDDAESGRYPTLPARPFVKTVRKVLADVTPETGCVLDRAALVLLLRTQSAWSPAHCERIADRILALVRPVAGVTLTPEEAALALRWKRDAVRHGYVIDIPDDDLTARLEAAQ